MDKHEELCGLLGLQPYCNCGRTKMHNFYGNAITIPELMEAMYNRGLLTEILKNDCGDCSACVSRTLVKPGLAVTAENLCEAEAPTPQAALAEACRLALKEVEG